MKFELIGTKTVLEPSSDMVEQSYIARPDLYKPIKTSKPKTGGEPNDSGGSQ